MDLKHTSKELKILEHISR